MSIRNLLRHATNKNNFNDLESYIEFTQRYLEFVENGLQAVIVSQNEQNYRFFQYRQDGNFNITRPINSHLMYSAENSNVISENFGTSGFSVESYPSRQDEIGSRFGNFQNHENLWR